jgi:Na+-transporting methylmalonyl-CoA/oxaloacetate decarboxylase gamma subunit
MFEILGKILESDAGSFGFVFAFLSLAFAIIWKVSHFSTKFESVQKLKSNIDIIKEDIHGIRAFMQVYRETNNPLAQRQSPVSMTEDGKNISKELGIEAMVANHWNEFKSSVLTNLKLDCNPYDIQVESFKVGDKYQQFITKEELDKIKLHAFNTGYNIATYNLLFGIIIRDKILTDKGHDTADVDLYDPAKSN